MDIHQSEQMLRERIDGMERRTVGNLLQAMVRFYRDARFETIPLVDNGDGLLLQWGTYDWGHGLAFELDLTRQFIVPGEDEPYQLSMTMRFEPTPKLTALGASNRWCFSLEELDAFEQFMRSTPPYEALASEEPEALEIHFEGV